jgi:hypothetical protein
MRRELHVTSPALEGEDVVDIQERLAALGYAPGPVDGLYGPTTAAAVRAFQGDRRLADDGAVGADTFAALMGPSTSSFVETPSNRRRLASPIGVKALAEAVRHVGLKEQPARSNRTPFGEWFGANGVPWCNIFVSYCFAVGAGYVIADRSRGAGVRSGRGCAYVPTTEAWLRATGMWMGRTEPQPGDIAVFNWDAGFPDHIGIVENSLTGGGFVSIEGNTAIGNDSNGGEVMRRKRELTQVDGFGRVM